MRQPSMPWPEAAEMLPERIRGKIAALGLFGWSFYILVLGFFIWAEVASNHPWTHCVGISVFSFTGLMLFD